MITEKPITSEIGFAIRQDFLPPGDRLRQQGNRMKFAVFHYLIFLVTSIFNATYCNNPSGLM
ncbi:MAG: hypothetical protein KAR13_17170 [Desulfobulbaceae bacterium]|nr:hypothetical protein [Desulfobulbaceae bacterium]